MNTAAASNLKGISPSLWVCWTWYLDEIQRPATQTQMFENMTGPLLVEVNLLRVGAGGRRYAINETHYARAPLELHDFLGIVNLMPLSHMTSGQEAKLGFQRVIGGARTFVSAYRHGLRLFSRMDHPSLLRPPDIKASGASAGDIEVPWPVIMALIENTSNTFRRCAPVPSSSSLYMDWHIHEPKTLFFVLKNRKNWYGIGMRLTFSLCSGPMPRTAFALTVALPFGGGICLYYFPDTTIISPWFMGMM
ncbi:hypothetical protein F5887DRAFT_919411 [Amanita rubescens]|nr:hypothetical protein F5887DRAFT_919411 [Amanita rubescens]